MALATRLALTSLAASFALTGAALAKPIDLTQQSDVEMMATAALAQTLRAKCEASGEMSSDTRQAVATWEKANHLDRVAAEIMRLGKDPATRAVIATLAQQVEEAAATVEPQSCPALIALLDVPAASFGKRASSLPAVSASKRAEVAPDARSDQPAKTRKSGKGAKAHALADQIEGFGFDQRPVIGNGGMIMLDIYPVVLFKDGRLLTDVGGLDFAGGIEAHQQENPRAWTRWRKSDGRFELLGGDKWRPFAFNAIYDKVPPGFRLTGRYDTMANTGNIAIGGTDSVTVWEAYEFWPGGEVIKGRTAGADVAGGDYRTTAQATSPDRRDRYSIDGLTLSITYDDGASESVILVTDPKDPDVIWLNGRGFVKAE
ncbi:MAG: hypothetical protein FJX66_16650, partial [Alphaproteobacteria bacterium]|nr:hypothetical protein [Alphaproteobacteria bacterium]